MATPVKLSGALVATGNSAFSNMNSIIGPTSLSSFNSGTAVDITGPITIYDGQSDNYYSFNFSGYGSNFLTYIAYRFQNFNWTTNRPTQLSVDNYIGKNSRIYTIPVFTPETNTATIQCVFNDWSNAPITLSMNVNLQTLSATPTITFNYDGASTITIPVNAVYSTKSFNIGNSNPTYTGITSWKIRYENETLTEFSTTNQPSTPQTHNYAYKGVFTPQVSATNLRGTFTSNAPTLTVRYANPSIDFYASTNTPEPGQSVIFYPTIATAFNDNVVGRVNWNYGTGSAHNIYYGEMRYLYNYLGYQFDVVLAATGSDNNASNLMKADYIEVVGVNPTFTAINISPSYESITVGQPITLEASYGTSAYHTSRNVRLYWGDSVYSDYSPASYETEKTFGHTYYTPGTYTLKGATTASYGGTTNFFSSLYTLIDTPITVAPMPIPVVTSLYPNVGVNHTTYYELYIGQSFQMRSTWTKNVNDTITHFYGGYSFGETELDTYNTANIPSQNGNIENSNYSFSSANTYTATLFIVGNYSNQSDTAVTSIVVVPEVTATIDSVDISYIDSRQGQYDNPTTVNFEGSETHYSGYTFSSYLWRFGDGVNNTSGLQNPSHNYTITKNLIADYNVEFTASLTNGKKAYDSFLIQVFPSEPPIATHIYANSKVDMYVSPWADDQPQYSGYSTNHADNSTGYVNFTVDGSSVPLTIGYIVVSEANFDFMNIYVNSSLVRSVSGETISGSYSTVINGSSIPVRIEYAKDGSQSFEDDMIVNFLLSYGETA